MTTGCVKGGADNVVQLWDLTSGKQMATFDSDAGGHRGSITDLMFHPFEFVLASVSAQDRSAKLWDLENFSLIDTVSNVTSSGKSPSNPHLLFSSKGGIDDKQVGEEGKTGGREDNEMLVFAASGLRSYYWEVGAYSETTQVPCDWDAGKQKGKTSDLLNIKLFMLQLFINFGCCYGMFISVISYQSTIFT